MYRSSTPSNFEALFEALDNSLICENESEGGPASVSNAPLVELGWISECEDSYSGETSFSQWTASIARIELLSRASDSSLSSSTSELYRNGNSAVNDSKKIPNWRQLGVGLTLDGGTESTARHAGFHGH